ncbi:thiomuracin/GE37468 family thiazolyl RiPP peptide [Nocardiopsis changdeensis]|uniref:GE37468 family thiazolyl peptide n=1 Tax=Nocardiopsis changdeensis TaxID=2831969 RepID=A0ABX8BV70_9ACTN|nr:MULTISPECIES: thiomuracin/GE37468 family thiazolyl RiPP peptide [Nocardiopsis]QUX25109.1 GE37468 family thiazolyl peptide [Nocardiopsis changdeensis]QYX35495.1 GE37468 family thiazolyl peptide [Nocardiopsis sp. MT53]
MATQRNAARFDIDDLPVDVFDLVADGTVGESLAAGHGMTEYDASRAYITCNCYASCTCGGSCGSGGGGCGGGSAAPDRPL